jgi:hypothetical protein
MVYMSKKNLVSLIKKMAQDLQDPPGVDMSKLGPKPVPANVAATPPEDRKGTIEPTPSTSPSTDPARTYTPAPDIVAMQHELINLAHAVTQEIGTSAPQNIKPGETSPQASDEQKEAAGRLAFSNFITEHYVRQSDVPAVEYNPDPAATDMSQKHPARPTRTNVVMNTMSRVGGPNNEFKVDGKWGPRTNAALRNAYALAFALLKMAQDFKLSPPPQSFDQGDLAQLKELTPLHDTDILPTDKVTRAKSIIKYLRGIRNLFNEVKDRILQKPAYRSYIEGTQAYTTYQKSQAPSSQMVEDLSKKFTNMKVTGVTPDNKTKEAPITVSDLVSPQAFQLWQKTNFPTMSAQDILNQLKKYLDNTDFKAGVLK